MLILATLPNILSWVIVGLASHNVVALIMSRILAGVSIGLMASNVYIADVASTKNIVFFNYMRQIFVTLGAILMYATMQTIYKVKQPKNSEQEKQNMHAIYKVNKRVSLLITWGLDYQHNF